MKFVEFIIPAYNKIDSLRSCLSALMAQTSNDWSATVVVDGQNDDIALLISSLDMEGIKLIETGIRYNDWGHTPREIGKNQSSALFTIMTGDDNYYVPVFVEEFKKVYELDKENTDFIYCDMVHNGYDYSAFESQPAYNYIDIGNFALKAEIAKTIPLGKEYAADGLFVEEYKRRHGMNKIKKIKKYLYVHN